ncbi:MULTISPECIES: DUF5677 domain-containing protein [unclassified Methylophaga]|jgi:hypothetical protein|uniref:DUF6988 family protein n=1 Tax=unclassified Methylophaga TaxID=2629249 RepID=UPI0023B7277E|nr:MULTISPECIES: DUF5677 domain-containing protein [unclassified Methylophaga]|tara:strand:- start:1275 stop:1856 length:582 start_codon:yes stop_codon:yes gene_type:complete
MEKSKKNLLLLERALHDIELPCNDKVMVASAYYSISMEHYRSILTLLEIQLYSSAGALLRSLFESYVKGLWFYYCSNTEDIVRLRKDKFEKPFSMLVSEIEDKKGKGLSTAKKNLWRALNGLTHSGAGQVSRRISDESIGSNFDELFIEDVKKFTNNYGLLVAGELALISNDRNAQNTVLEVQETLGFSKLNL